MKAIYIGCLCLHVQTSFASLLNRNSVISYIGQRRVFAALACATIQCFFFFEWKIILLIQTNNIFDRNKELISLKTLKDNIIFTLIEQ